jgi:hypothetical protein
VKKIVLYSEGRIKKRKWDFFGLRNIARKRGSKEKSAG